jgi:cobalt-zinc-cadmium resistance protein CzcA
VATVGEKRSIGHSCKKATTDAKIMHAAVHGAGGSLTVIETESMPRLDEGSILVETRKFPSISLTDSVEISKRIE